MNNFELTIALRAGDNVTRAVHRSEQRPDSRLVTSLVAEAKRSFATIYEDEPEAAFVDLDYVRESERDVGDNWLPELSRRER